MNVKSMLRLPAAPGAALQVAACGTAHGQVASGIRGAATPLPPVVGAQQPVSATSREWKAIVKTFGRANDDATELAKMLRHAVDRSNIKPAG